MAFGVARNSKLTSKGTLSFPQDVANVDGWYRQGLDYFAARSSGLYFLFVCIGVAPQSKVSVWQAGGYPSMGYTYQSTSHDGVKLGCRASIASLSTGTRVALSTTGHAYIFNSNPQSALFRNGCFQMTFLDCHIAIGLAGK